jgi:hypothetical protein
MVTRLGTAAQWRQAVETADDHRHLSTLPGWRRFTSEPVTAPDVLPRQRFSSLDDAGRADYNELRLDYHTHPPRRGRHLDAAARHCRPRPRSPAPPPAPECRTPAMTGDQLLPLPRQVRPSAPETAERYVHRLAEANHLRPSYLRQLLTTPPNSLGSIQLDKLAVLAGRDPANLVRALPELIPRPRTPGRTRENEARKTHNEQRKRERFAAIRYVARLGMSIRALATKHHVSRRTVGKALQSEVPPPRKKIERQPTVLLGLREHIDAMLVR